jgi:hypothetical protein
VEDSYDSAILRWFGKVLLIDAAGLAVVAILGLMRGWETPAAFGTGIFYVGVAIAGIGALGSIGTTSFSGNPDIRYVQTVSPEASLERDRRHRLDWIESLGLTVLLLTAGMVCIVLGGIISRMG